MKLRKSIALLFIFYTSSLQAQILKPGFDKEEYKNMMYISANSTASESYASKYPKPIGYELKYQSPSMGLDNLWTLWTNDNKVAVISLRGTTQKPESWLANFYAAMVPAKGELELSKDFIFNYTLANHPEAKVHIGWLISTAYLSKDILPKIDSCYKQGIRDMIIVGHSQGGAISFLLTSYLLQLQKTQLIPSDIKFKTYCSAAPKPGNLYFAYEYEYLTRGNWSYNVVNSADWVPETPVSIQTVNDFNKVNPFIDAKSNIKKQKFPANIVLKRVYKKLDNSTKKAVETYEKYLGDMAYKIVSKTLTEYEQPEYANCNNYVRTGNTIVLFADNEYYKIYPDDKSLIFQHHLHAPYLYLIDKQY